MLEGFGLMTHTSEPVPLKGVKVEGDILGRGARVWVSERFRNEESTAIEAVYKFPLPEAAAICGFKARVDGRLIRGEVEEGDKAFDMYDDALSRGDGAYLLDEERPNIFTLSVGNLNPGSDVVTEIAYVTLLDGNGRDSRFFLPTTISPRYIPDGGKEEDGIPEDGKLHPPYALDVPYGLSISIRIHKGTLLRSIESPSHQIRIEDLKGDPVLVTLSSDSVRMDRDFILNIVQEGGAAAKAYRSQADGEGFLQVDLFPSLDREEEESVRKQEKEIVFLVDCSGSMTGDSIRDAAKALEICLRGMDRGCTFNIWRFGSTFESLFDKSMPCADKEVAKALEYTRNMEANLGGTEILPSLRAICCSGNGETNGTRDIVLMTDAQVGNEKEVFDLVNEAPKRTRIFPIGIGAGSNEHFIKGLARAGRGAPEFIYPGERIEPKVIRMFRQLSGAMTEEVELLSGPEPAEQAPISPVAFPGMPRTVFARGKAGDFDDEKISIRAKVNGREKVWEVDVLEAAYEGVPIPQLWARERIRDLEESRANKGSRQAERKKLKQAAVVKISKRYGVLSRSTSYVAVEEREEKDRTTGEVALRKVPVLLTAGWHGIGSVLAKRFPNAVIGGDPNYRFAQKVYPGLAEFSGPVYCRQSRSDTTLKPAPPPDPRGLLERLRDRTGSPPPRVEAPFQGPPDQAYDASLLVDILSVQRPGGGIELNPGVARRMHIDLDEMRRLANEMTVRIPVNESLAMINPMLVLSTAIVILFLERRFHSDRATWEEVIRKSRDWLSEIVRGWHPKIQNKNLIVIAGRFA